MNYYVVWDDEGIIPNNMVELILQVFNFSQLKYCS